MITINNIKNKENEYSNDYIYNTKLDMAIFNNRIDFYKYTERTYKNYWTDNYILANSIKK